MAYRLRHPTPAQWPERPRARTLKPCRTTWNPTGSRSRPIATSNRARACSPRPRACITATRRDAKCWTPSPASGASMPATRASRSCEAIRAQAAELDYAPSFHFAHPKVVRLAGRICRARAQGPRQRLLLQFGLGSRRHRDEDRARLFRGQRPERPLPLREPRALLSRRQFRRHVGRRPPQQPEGLRSASSGYGSSPADSVRCRRKTASPRASFTGGENYADALEKDRRRDRRDTIAAVIVEPMTGSGGVFALAQELPQAPARRSATSTASC